MTLLAAYMLLAGFGAALVYTRDGWPEWVDELPRRRRPVARLALCLSWSVLLALGVVAWMLMPAVVVVDRWIERRR